MLRREHSIINSFTLESTYCGMDIGERKGYHIQIADLEKLGADFARAINSLLVHSEFPRMLHTAALHSVSVKSAPVSADSSAVPTPKRSRKSISKTVPKKPISSVVKTNLKKKGETRPPLHSRSVYSKEDMRDSDDDSSDDDGQ